MGVTDSLVLIFKKKCWYLILFFSLYKPVRRKLFAIIEQELQRPFHIRHLFDFGRDTLVMPLLIMPELITERISPNQQGWAYSIWLHILHLQLKAASRNRRQFQEGIKVNR